MTTDEARGGVASVAKACRVLRAFSPTVGVLSVRQVSAKAGIPRSTAHELCRTLVAEGMLEGAGGGYQLGPTILELAGQIIERTGLLRAAEGLLDPLVRAPEQEAHLAQLTQGWVAYVGRSSNPCQVPMLNQVGQRAPAHLSGCGKAALSWLPFDEVTAHVERCCADGAVPPPDLAELEAELTRARQDGFVTSRAYQKDRTSVAAPIFDSSGRPIGGVSVAGPSTMFTTAVIASARASVTNAAGLISARLINATPAWAKAALH
ncbi:IclR family transcriptional regulator [Amycolatopsis rhabdoformis]|uniref:IclR family transcriptional regulator n=1 Tax=Amycolatopsis rhabdoformis TaxID=1448059 RepID=A0ABZ1IJY3_9PSEU|nr:IclR family transcriptional regulator [Amycolatopsis rhabdoformis]WSE34181.1 IclR family transcriptional regulator [Amycolatopsis rhabdoformis]